MVWRTIWNYRKIVQCYIPTKDASLLPSYTSSLSCKQANNILWTHHLWTKTCTPITNSNQRSGRMEGRKDFATSLEIWKKWVSHSMEGIQSRGRYMGVWRKSWKCIWQAPGISSKLLNLLNGAQTKGRGNVTNFIQLVSLQLVNQFSQTKLHWKALNEGYLYIYGMYENNNKQLRYKAISNCKSFICQMAEQIYTIELALESTH